MGEINKARRLDRIERSISMRTKDYYALSSKADIAYLVGPWVLGLGFLLFLPLFFGSNYYMLGVFTTAGVYALLAMSWTLLATIGLFSLGHAMYIGIAGYAIGLLNVSFNIPLYGAVAGGLLLGTLICVGLLTLCLRVKHIYFLLATFVIPLMLTQLCFLFPRLFGGEEGISGIKTLSYGPIPLHIGNYYLVAIMVVIALLLLRRFTDSKNVGLIVACIGDNEYAVEASGINVWKYKVLVFTLCTLIALTGGALNVLVIGYVGPSFLSMDISLLPLLGSIIGGVARGMVGSVFGTYLLVVLLESLRITSHLKVIIYALILIAVMLARPKGLFYYISRNYQYVKRISNG